MNSEVEVRTARPGDIHALLALDRATESAPHWPVRAYAEMLLPDGPARRHIVVAEHAATWRLTGYAIAALREEAVAEIESVAVAPGARRCGVARALCGELVGWCRGQGVREIELEVRSRSAPAIALYAALGFTEFARRVGYYRVPEDDAILMRLVLS
ncbi:MAG TPA: GNAT family N-acetyltransferase [Acidobacteriaceae bacterium]|nr:GNAT family N-acetyltransferase [Acidobacteriaceae bacterium]